MLHSCYSLSFHDMLLWTANKRPQFKLLSFLGFILFYLFFVLNYATDVDQDGKDGPCTISTTVMWVDGDSQSSRLGYLDVWSLIISIS